MARHRTILEAGIGVFGLKKLLFETAVENNLDINIQTTSLIFQTHLITLEGEWNDIHRFIHVINACVKNYNDES